MRYMYLGRTDLKVSQVCLGGMSFGSAGWMVNSEDAKTVLKKASDLGINYIDTANIYSTGESEKIIGEFIKDEREEFIISTKVGGKVSEKHYGFARREIEFELNLSLKRLRTDYIDIYLSHTWFDGLDTVDVLKTFSRYVEINKIGYFGLSNIKGYQLAEIDHLAEDKDLARPQIVQNHYNAIYREDEREVIPYCINKGISFSAFSPLAAGFLSGKYERGIAPKSIRSKEYSVMLDRYFKENDFDVLDDIRAIAKEQSATEYAISLAYVLQKKFIPVVGVSKKKHLDDVVTALEISLTDDQVKRIEKHYLPHRLEMGTAGY
jgi:aryl-alcohol dehydrogenase-like predicted oxidoreductase